MVASNNADFNKHLRFIHYFVFKRSQITKDIKSFSNITQVILLMQNETRYCPEKEKSSQ